MHLHFFSIAEAACLNVGHIMHRSLLAIALLITVIAVHSANTATEQPQMRLPYLTEDELESAIYIVPVEQGISLSPADFANGQKLTIEELYGKKGKYKLYQQQNFKGDIRGKATWTFRVEGVGRNGVALGRHKWRDGHIPYLISTDYTDRERAILARAISQYHRRTCLRFRPRSSFDKDYLFIGKIDGCFSDVGKAGGRQEVSLDDGCLQYDTAIHELMHAIGFYHEHERWDRDLFIRVLWPNIDRQARDQFGRVDPTASSYYGQPYDYLSVMHYDSRAFSKNGLHTLTARRPFMTPLLGQALDFSRLDLAKVNAMYGCQRSSHQCRDRTGLCWRWIDRCKSYFFDTIMLDLCPKFCGFCSPTESFSDYSV